MDEMRKAWQPVLENCCVFETMLEQLLNNKGAIINQVNQPNRGFRYNEISGILWKLRIQTAEKSEHS